MASQAPKSFKESTRCHLPTPLHRPWDVSRSIVTCISAAHRLPLLTVKNLPPFSKTEQPRRHKEGVPPRTSPQRCPSAVRAAAWLSESAVCSTSLAKREETPCWAPVLASKASTSTTLHARHIATLSGRVRISAEFSIEAGLPLRPAF